jgi:hypothetical protein
MYRTTEAGLRTVPKRLPAPARWVAPENLSASKRDRPVTPQSDAYSFGLVCLAVKLMLRKE